MELGPKQREWLDALKSGKYIQGTGHLCRIVNGELRYCCLGVGCAINGIVEAVVHDVVLFNGASDLSKDFAEIVKLKDVNGSVYFSDITLDFKEDLKAHQLNPGATPCLSAMNDKGFTFPEIVAILEKYPEKFFKESA